ncbi:uncharacterized protein LOC111709130 isoform X2 [Eurytemora carolleeae]|uniref:uncharacterized protein LOC111709130 isoform X2 n=1 Tax=Eurytemora carolleeae TaxID=1294199 RepID=UPI000C75B08A|nr:uncharacterized protein LOC111709130 isoform X2 [Eurytemora carolleeae]|eukprot:XP_023338505.1 uncharacterized protein LOC111709130 isoform X2 [Eurytemora affinis]
MKILCLLFLLLGRAEGVDRTAVNFLANFWLSVAGFASVFIVLVSIWLDFWIRSDQRTEKDELKVDEIIELRVENELIAETCVVEVEEKPPVLPQPAPPPAPTSTPLPPPPASLHRHPVARKRRDRIPKKSEMKLNLLELLSAIGGQSLTRVSMPIIYNEPISMLQRLVNKI